MKNYLITVLLLSVAPCVAAQEVVRADDFLQRLIAEPVLPDDYADHRRVRLPWIQAYEYRTETDEFDLDRQEHALRISPNTPGLHRAQSRLAAHYRQRRSVIEAGYRHDRIEAAYEAWKDLYVGEQQLAHYTQLEAILADRLTLQRKQLQAANADYKEVLNVQERLNDARIRRYELTLATRSLRQQFGLDTTATVLFDDMLTMDQLLLRLSADSGVVRDPRQREYRYERELIEREMALEQAERWQLLDFVQVRYNGPHDELFEERVQLRAGFVLPTSGNRNLKLEELRLEQEELTREQQVKQRELVSRVAQQRRTVRNQVRVYQEFEKIKDEELAQLQSMAQAVAKRQGTDPDLLLKIAEDTEQIRLEKLERQEEIYEDYLAYLSLTGQLYVDAEENYLSE